MGLRFYLPAFSSTAGTSMQTEGAAITETDPSTAFQSAQVGTAAGMATISLQLADRGFGGGGSFDAVIGRQLQQQLEESVNGYVLSARSSVLPRR